MKLRWRDVRHVAAARGAEVVTLPNFRKCISEAQTPGVARRELTWTRRACDEVEAVIDEWELEQPTKEEEEE
jgi:hypothetical protein